MNWTNWLSFSVELASIIIKYFGNSPSISQDTRNSVTASVQKYVAQKPVIEQKPVIGSNQS